MSKDHDIVYQCTVSVSNRSSQNNKLCIYIGVYLKQLNSNDCSSSKENMPESPQLRL